MTVVRRTRKGGFTLVEILIVVIILGILAAIVIPQFTSASQDARKNSLTSQLQTVRSQVELYKLQHLDALPPTWSATGTPDWTVFVNKSKQDASTGTTTDYPFGPYLQAVPTNPLNGNSEIGLLTADPVSTDPTVGYTTAAPAKTNGFALNPDNGKIWGTSALGGFIYFEGNANASNNEK